MKAAVERLSLVTMGLVGELKNLYQSMVVVYKVVGIFCCFFVFVFCFFSWALLGLCWLLLSRFLLFFRGERMGEHEWQYGVADILIRGLALGMR